MAKNKDTMQGNLTGIVDVDEMTVTHIDKDGGETVYDLKKFLQKYDGLETSLTAKVDSDIQPTDV